MKIADSEFYKTNFRGILIAISISNILIAIYFFISNIKEFRYMLGIENTSIGFDVPWLYISIFIIVTLILSCIFAFLGFIMHKFWGMIFSIISFSYTISELLFTFFYFDTMIFPLFHVLNLMYFLSKLFVKITIVIFIIAIALIEIKISKINYKIENNILMRSVILAALAGICLKLPSIIRILVLVAKFEQDYGF